MYKILFAHQSTIPHYRVSFYNSLECLRPDSWNFDVVFDPDKKRKKVYFRENINSDYFKFSILQTKTVTLQIFKQIITYQTFWEIAGKYDLIIIENAVNNLSYPLCYLHKINGTKLALWGHDRDRSILNYYQLKKIIENLKLRMAKNADGFFAYTKGVKDNLVARGVPERNIFTINNTIDINEQRKAYRRFRKNRDAIRKNLGLENKSVLLLVGRLNKKRRIHFLYDAFEVLQEKYGDKYHLLIVGSGEDKFKKFDNEGITYFGPIIDLDNIAPLYVASDLFVIPGWVGLGPLQAMCYDLPIITIDSELNPPEIDYLDSKNSIILPKHSSSDHLAIKIDDLLSTPEKYHSLRSTVWASINHLTIENMTKNFIKGINTILNQ